MYSSIFGLLKQLMQQLIKRAKLISTVDSISVFSTFHCEHCPFEKFTDIQILAPTQILLGFPNNWWNPSLLHAAAFQCLRKQSSPRGSSIRCHAPLSVRCRFFSVYASFFFLLQIYCWSTEDQRRPQKLQVCLSSPQTSIPKLLSEWFYAAWVDILSAFWLSSGERLGVQAQSPDVLTENTLPQFLTATDLQMCVPK